MPTVDSWNEMFAYVQKTNNVVNDLPPPPNPDRQWAENVHKLKTAMEGVSELCKHYKEQEDQA